MRKFLKVVCQPMRPGIIFFILLQAFSFKASAQSQQIRFKNLSASDGLSQNLVQCILKDKRGFMWFGTRNGLNRYDGYSFKVYHNDIHDPTSVASNSVNDIAEDAAGNIWIGTNLGLNKYVRDKDAFVLFNPGTLTMKISDLMLGSDGKIWITTVNMGLVSFDPRSRKFEVFANNAANPNSLINNEATKVCMVDETSLLVATRRGLDLFDIKKKTFSHFASNPNNPQDPYKIGRIRDVFRDSKGNVWLSVARVGLALYNKEQRSFTYFPASEKGVSDGNILSISEGGAGKLWLGTESKGLCVYDVKTGTAKDYLPEPFNPTSLSHHTVRVVYRDRDNVVWLGTQSGGVNIAATSNYKFQHFTHLPSSNSLSNKFVTSIAGDAEGQVWLGTDGGGLNRFNPATGQFTSYKSDTLRKRKTISSDFVSSVRSLQDGRLALGYSKDGGLDIFDHKKGALVHFAADLNPESVDNRTVGGKTISNLMQDQSGNLWIASQGSGVNRLDLGKRIFAKYKSVNDGSGQVTVVVFATYQDHNGNIWIGSQDGLQLYDPGTDTFKTYPILNGKNHAAVNSILDDGKGNLWLATTEGLFLFNCRTSATKRISTKNGLPSDILNSMLQDDRGNLWLGTSNGLCRFDPIHSTFSNFNVSDGLQSQEFNVGAAYKSADGTMYFGGANGFNAFHPTAYTITMWPPRWC